MNLNPLNESDAARRDRTVAEANALRQECSELRAALRWLLVDGGDKARDNAVALLAKGGP